MKNCTLGKPCGNTCIKKDRTCFVDPSTVTQKLPTCTCGKPCGKTCINKNWQCRFDNVANQVECVDIVVPVTQNATIAPPNPPVNQIIITAPNPPPIPGDIMVPANQNTITPPSNPPPVPGNIECVDVVVPTDNAATALPNPQIVDDIFSLGSAFTYTIEAYDGNSFGSTFS